MTPARLVILAATVAALVARAPTLWATPRFWAEEGTRYFELAWAAHTRGDWWTSLINTPATLSVGYFALWPNLASTLAAAVPLDYAQLVTTVMAAMVQLAVVAYWLWATFDLWPAPWQKVAGAAILVLAPLSAEVWLNTINSQFFFLMLTVLVLCARTDGARAIRVSGRVALALASLTGSVSCLLAPWFVGRAWTTGERERWVQAGILCAGAAVQVVVALLALSTPDSLIGQRAGLPPASTIVAVAWTQSLGLVLAGIGLMRQFADQILAGGGLGHAAWLWAVAAVAALAALTTGLTVRERAALLSVYVTLVVAVITTSLGDDKLALVPPGVAERYFLTANVVLMLTILAAAGRWPLRAWQGLALRTCLVWTLVHGGIRFTEQPFVRADYPEWRTEVSRWRADPAYHPQIWPAGWAVRPPTR